VGIPLKQPKIRKKEDYSNLENIKDEWQIDFKKLRESLNDKTKILILNTPNNHNGKILN
jgi:aspartate/methionine/tyrosine aminotransferase